MAKNELIDNWGTTNAGFGEKTYMTDMADFINKKEIKKFSEYRFIGSVILYKQVWIPVYKDGKPLPSKIPGKNLQIPKMVTNFDPETQKYDETKPCPYLALSEKMNKHLGDKEKSYESTNVIACCIDRNAQENLPGKIKPPTKDEEKSGFRDINSSHKNPVRVFQFTGNEFGKVKGTMELNTIKLKSGEKVVKSLADPKYGYDISLKWDENAKVKSDKLKVQKSERTPLTEEELEYLAWDLQGCVASQIEKLKDAKRECDRLWAEFEKFLKKSGKSDEEDSDDEPEDLDDEDEKPKKKKKKVEEDDEEEEEKPKKKKKKVVEEDEDEDDKKSKAKKKKKKVEEDDDEDLDDDDLELDSDD